MFDLKIKLIFLFISILVNCYSVSVWQDWILSLDFQKIRVDLKPEVHLHFSGKKIILFFILQKRKMLLLLYLIKLWKLLTEFIKKNRRTSFSSACLKSCCSQFYTTYRVILWRMNTERERERKKESQNIIRMALR
jgi:hypothetical protein